jgi:hypothetical protein
MSSAETVTFPAVSGPEPMPVAFAATSAGVTIDPDSGDGYLIFGTDTTDPEQDDVRWTPVDSAVALGTTGIVVEVMYGQTTDFDFDRGDKVHAWLKWVDSPNVIVRKAINYIRTT